MLNKWKQLNGFLIKEADFAYVQDEIIKNNIRVSLGFAVVSLVMLIIMLGTTFVMEVQRKHRTLFILTIIVVIGMLFFMQKIAKYNPKATMVATHLTIACIMLYGIIMSYNVPEQNTVTFIATMPIIFMLFVDKPRRMAGIVTFWLIIFLLMVHTRKAENIRVSDTVNAVTFTLLSIMNGFLVIEIKVHNYVMGKRLRYLSEKDEMTGLNNRNSFERRICAYIPKANETLACVYIDVNGLHELNNTEGYTAGDDMLQFVAQVLKDTFGSDSTYRIGGDEFVALVVNVSQTEIAKQVGRMKTAVSEHGYHISIGLEYSEGAQEDVSIPNMMKRAEQKMYHDKRNFYTQNGFSDRRRN